MKTRPLVLLSVVSLGLIAASLWSTFSVSPIAAEAPISRTMPVGHPSAVLQAPAPLAATVAGATAEKPGSSDIGARATKAPRQPDLSKLAAFDNWLSRWKAAPPEERTAMEAQGRELGAQRRAEMKNLIVADPEQAIRSAVPYEVRMQLPPGVVAQLETPVNTHGNYYVEARLAAPGEALDAPPIRRFAEIDGKSYAVNAYRQGLRRLTRENTSIHGVAVDGELALNETPFRRLSREEVAFRQSKGELNGTCKVSGASLKDNPDAPAVDIGGDLLISCSPGHLEDDINHAWAAAGGGDNGSGGAFTPLATPIVGPKTCLFIRVRFADQGDASYVPQTQASIDQQKLDAELFHQEASLGASTLTITNTPTYTLPKATAAYVNWPEVLADARVLAAADGYNPANYNYDGVRYNGGVGLVAAFRGVGYVGGKGIAVRDDSRGVFSHEFGHNLGLWHANSWRAADGSVIGTGQNSEYGDIFDTMGGADSGVRSHYNTVFKYQLGWIPGANVQTAATGAGAFNTYRVHANDMGGAIVPSLKYGIRLMKDAEREYWVSYRQHAGWGPAMVGNMGAELHWDTWLATNGTQVLDMNPGTAGNTSDATLAVGRTFSDMEADLHFTVTQKVAAAGGNPPALDVVVAKGPFAGNLAPTVALSVTPANPAANQAATLNAVASDPNGDTLSYYWTDARGAVLGNVASGDKSWALPGWKRVSCTVSDMKGMVDVQSLNIPVGAASPAPWRAMDVGATGVEGGDAYDAALGKFTVHGAGADIWGSADEFRFVYQKMRGDGEIVARVTSQQNTHAWAKAGVMIREDLSAGSVNAITEIAPTGKSFQWRATAGQNSLNSNAAAVAVPHWVKIKRVGNQVSGWFAPDASGAPGAWTQQGSAQNLALSETVYVGLAVTSRSNTAVGQATFDHVSVNATKVVEPKFFTANTGMGAGAAIGTATATGGGITGWSIVGGNTGGAFAINAAGQVTLQTPAALPNPGAVQLLVRATDANGVVGDGTIYITCNDTSLLAWWKLDDAAGTVADDSSGTYDGTLNNAPAWSAGYAGGALAFNGTNQYVAVPALGLTSTNTLTISAWVKRNGSQASAAGLVFQRGTTISGMMVGSNNELRYTWNGDFATYGFSTGLILPDNVWTYCAVVIEPTKATLYMQPEGGPLQSKVNAVANPAVAFNTGIRLAHDTYDASRYFKGQLDDVRIYSRALTQAELAPQVQVPPTIVITSPVNGADLTGTVTVSATVDSPQPVTAVEFYRDGVLISSDSSAPYSAAWSSPSLGAHTLTARAVFAGGAVDAAPVGIDVVPAGNSDADGDGFARELEVALGTDPDNAASKPSSIYSGLRGWWKLDETSGQVAFDSSGNDSDGTLINGPLWKPGIKDGGLDLNPSDSNEVVQLPPLGLNTNSLTLSAWVKRRGDQDDYTGLIFDRGTVANGMHFGPDNDLRYSWSGVSGGGYSFASGLTVPDGVWTFCAVVIEPTKATLYMRPVGQAVQVAVKTASHTASAFSNVLLGYDKTSVYRHFKGTMDDVHVHSRSLSAAEINALYAESDPAHAPVFAADPVILGNATEDTAYTGTLAGSASDMNEGDTPTYSKVSGPAWLNVAGNGALTGTPGNGDVGSNSFTVRVTDSGGLTDDAVFNISVVNVNDAPVFAADPMDGGSATEDQAYSGTLAGSSSDMDAGDTPTYSKVSGPAWLSVASDGALTGIPGNGNVGSNSFTVRVTDGGGLTDDAVFNVAVINVNDPPVFTADPLNLSATEDSAFTGQLAATDVDPGDTRTYIKVSGPAWLSVSGSGALSGTPTNAQVGNNAFVVRVTDGSGLTDEAALNITVANVNDAPVFTVDPVLAADATIGTAYTGQTLAGSATDADSGDIPIYTKVSGPAWLSVATNGALTGTPPAGSTGLNTFVIRATDGSSATDDAELRINVLGLPLPWTNGDIGTGMLAGSASHSSGTFTLAGSGALGGLTDKLQFVYQTLTGDGEITARVTALQNTGNSSRVGVMIRETLATNSRQAFFGLSNAGNYRWERRFTPGASNVSVNSSTGTVPNTWVRLVRSGVNISAYKSSDGITWTLVTSGTVSMAANCYIGLAVSSGSNTTLNTSQFSNISVTP